MALSSTLSDSNLALDEKGPNIRTTLAHVEKAQPTTRGEAPPPKNLFFWVVFFAICLSLFLSALEMTAVSSALPTILEDLHGDDFVWVSSAYTLASTCLIPASGGLAEVFGRRPLMLASIGLFALGSALCGSAKNMAWLIGGRTVQGAGGGGIFSLAAIIVGDLVTLRERGAFQGMIGLVWTVAAGMGPVVGGALAKQGQWRWLFYLNLPVSGLAAGLVLIFLRLKTPPGTLSEKLTRMDWIGNILITSSSAACVLALSWGGARFPWSSARVLVPLILGLLGMCGFMVYEHKVAREPIIPFSLLSNKTSLSGYVQTFINPVLMFAIIYFMPVYYQACFGVTPLRSGVLALAICATVGPTVVLSGASVAITKKYRVQLWLGWVLAMIGMGVQSTLHADSSLASQVGLPILTAIGLGIIYAATYFPVLAPLPLAENAHALALFAFSRSFGAVWGVTIGTAVLQNELEKRLPESFLSKLPGGVAIAYSAIPAIANLPEQVRVPVRVAFAESLSNVWEVMIGVAAIGLISSFFMKSLPLHTQVDEKWGLEDNVRAAPGATENPPEGD